jgi:phosphoribosylamine--glycine ligase
MIATAEHKLDEVTMEWDPRPGVCVVMSSEGYPGPYEKGRAISGIEDAEAVSEDVKVFQAGTAEKGGQLVNAGGRVLGVTALGDTLQAARDLAYSAVDRIHWDGCYVRRDIGDKALH